MRKLAYNLIVILCATIMHNSLSGSSSFLGEKEYEKTIEKEFSINSGGLVNIENKYGTVKINTTNGNEVSIVVTMKVDKKNEDKAEDFFDKVDIEFSNSSSKVSAKTNIGKQSGRSWTRWLNPGNWNSNDNYSINYEVWMPASCKLDLSNKYGDIKHGDGVIEDIKGDLTLYLAYGDIKMGHAENIGLEVKYGELSCKSANDVECDTKYSDIYIDKARRLEVDSGYDDYFIGEIEVFVNDGGYDDFKIDYVDHFELDSKYTDYVIGELGSGGTFDSRYGDLKVKRVSGLSKGLTIYGSYSDVSLGMDLPYNIDLDSKYTDVDIPKRKSSGKNYTHIRDGNKVIIQTSNGDSNNDIKAKMKYGSFRIR